MSLGLNIQNQCLAELLNLYSDLYSRTQLTHQRAQAQMLLRSINELSARDDIPLSWQSEATLRELMENVRRAVEIHDDNAAVKIYETVKLRLNADTTQNQARHKAQGRFDATPLYTRPERDQLQDHDMTRFMPKSNGNIEVLAVANQYDHTSIRLAIDGIKSALRDETKKHILIPVGPGHYRLMSIMKPRIGEKQYSIALFGPYGEMDGKAIENLARDWLKQCGIGAENIAPPKYEGPAHRQTDGYSCGDYTCAHSHKKMKELGAQTGAYDERLIHVLEGQGNQGGALRNLLRNMSRNPAFIMGAEVTNASTNQPVAKKEHMFVKSKPHRDAFKHKPAFSKEEQCIFKANYVDNINNIKPQKHYKQVLTMLILNRNTIFSRAEKLVNKTTLSDEELAIKLQSEELKRAFKKK